MSAMGAFAHSAEGFSAEPKPSALLHTTRRPGLAVLEDGEMPMTNRMRKTIESRTIACVAILCFAAALNSQPPDAKQESDWKSFSYPSDGFQASTPVEPQLGLKDVSTDAGSFQLHSYIVQTAPVSMFIGVCDYGSSTEGRDPGTVLQGAEKAALSSSNSHLLREKKITLGVHPGIEFESESDAAHFTARIYLVATTLYETLVVAPLDKPYPETARFLNSFQLISKTSN
jgi:hypothetical protein